VDVESNSPTASDHPDNTLIILDWDDTLCPTFFLNRQCEFSVDEPIPDGEVAEALEEFASEVGALLELATELASRVVIVTNAFDGWVELSTQAWMPQLEGALEQIEIKSARSTWEPMGIMCPTSWKTKEFETVIGQHPWKNVIVVGDAPYEHNALQRILYWGETKEFKAKSVKFGMKLSLEELSTEIQKLRLRLCTIIEHAGHMDIDVSSYGSGMDLLG
jgi:hypothetical protein